MENSPVPEGWTAQLASMIATAVREYQAHHLHGESVVALYVDCAPYGGGIDLSLLTTKELAGDSTLLRPNTAAMAWDWQHSYFASSLVSWVPAKELGRQMLDACASTCHDQTATTEAFLDACAAAMNSVEVVSSLDVLTRDSRFRTLVLYPSGNSEDSHSLSNGTDRVLRNHASKEARRKRNRKARMSKGEDEERIEIQQVASGVLTLYSYELRGGAISLTEWHKKVSEHIGSACHAYAIHCFDDKGMGEGCNREKWIIQTETELAARDLQTLARIKRRIETKQLSLDNPNFIAEIKRLPTLLK